MKFSSFLFLLFLPVAVCTGVVCLLLLASLLNSWFALADSLSHFRAHYGAALALAAVAFVLLRRWQFAGLAIVGILLAAASIYPAWPVLSPQAKLSKPLKLIQFNLLFSNPTPDRSLAWIVSEAPDFVFLQEVSKKTVVVYDGLATTLPYGVTCKFGAVGNVAIRSRYPLKSQSCVESEGLTWATVDVNGTALTLASVHLHWPYPFGQWRQISTLEPELKAMPQPIILTGDFNAAPWSKATVRMAEATSTTVVPGFRLSLRMGPKATTFLPIDQVLLPASAVVGDIHLGPPLGSDHLPVLTTFEMK